MYLHRRTTPPALRNDRYANLFLCGDKLTDASTCARTVTNAGAGVNIADAAGYYATLATQRIRAAQGR